MGEPVPGALSSWQAAYWQRPVVRGACADMAEKYAALAALQALATGPEQDAALREASRRWPGCLRESQLSGPVRCEERRAQAQAGAHGAERSRAAWRAEGAEALVLWVDLHALLADLLTWRQQAAGARGLAGFVAFAAAGSAASRWPADSALLERAGGALVRSRLAYAWLAAQAGMELQALNWSLFGRRGHWDAPRPGDPPRT